MVDPIAFTSEYMAALASELTLAVLGVASRGVRDFFVGDPRRQALTRCFRAADIALLPPDHTARDAYLPILKAYQSQPLVVAEMTKLTRGRCPDLDSLSVAFADAVEGRNLPDFDFEERLACSVEAFLQLAETEPELRDTLQTAYLREHGKTLLAMAKDLDAIRTAIQVVRSAVGTGSITVEGSIRARDIITGTVNHIVNVYRAGGGTSSEQDYRAALDRYLDWVRANTGQVVLRGIKRGDEQVLQLSLDQVYVPLRAEAVPEVREKLKHHLAGQPDQVSPPQPISTRELLAQGRRLAVTGAPGCGKTTVLCHIAWALAEALRTGRPHLAEENLGLTGELPLPIYVPLSLYAEHRRQFALDRDPRLRQLAAFISHYLIHRQAGLRLPEDFFATLLDQGRHVILLLDGLDEVPNEDERALVSQAVSDLICSRDHCRVIVTSRTRAYEGQAVLTGGFRLVRVLPLDPDHVAALIRHAYAAIYPSEVDMDQRATGAADLIAGVQRLEAERVARLGDSDETRLVTTPLMVRMLLIVHFNERRMPDQRADLYMRLVDTLLNAAYNPDQEVAQRLAKMGGDWTTRRDLFQELAFLMHSRGGDAGREISEKDLAAELRAYLVERCGHTPDHARELTADFIAASRQRGGLLEERDGQHRFEHLSLQEFLTARYLAEVRRDIESIAAFFEERGRIADSWWREVVLLTVGYLNVTARATAGDLLRRLARLSDSRSSSTALQLAGTEVAAAAFLEWGGSDPARAALADRLGGLLSDATLNGATPSVRAAAGRALARLGDPRRGVGVISSPSAAGQAGSTLPDIEWCEVSAGPFLMGSEAGKTGDADERPRHELTLPTSYMARYPITNAQYAPFVDAGAYDEERWWTPAGWAWRNGAEADLSWIRGEDLRKSYVGRLAERPRQRRGEPFFRYDERFNDPNQPVVGATWHEAMAFAAWLSSQLLAPGTPLRVWRGNQVVNVKPAPNLCVRLPTEAEWEKAAGWDPTARGQRVYPWGDDWDSDKANTEDGHIGRPSAVGVFPAGDSPYGCLDMAGNVWEWTRSLYEKYPYRPNDGREDPEGKGNRVVRGGSWSYSRMYARVSSRNYALPGNFNYFIGLRVVVAPI